jgi:hypothetical protein
MKTAWLRIQSSIIKKVYRVYGIVRTLPEFVWGPLKKIKFWRIMTIKKDSPAYREFL